MDPNSALKALREALEAYNEDEREGLGDFDPLDLVQPLESLMAWLDNGGFLPTAWQRGYCPVVDRVVVAPFGGECPECGDKHPVG